MRHSVFIVAVFCLYGLGGARAAACNATRLPTAPILSAKSGNGEIEVCWTTGEDNGACLTQYRIAYLPMVVQTSPNQRVPGWSLIPSPPLNETCITISGLENMQLYRFAVQAYSAGARGGGAATVDGMPVRAWRCLPVRGYYPLCDAVYNGECNPISCEEQKAKGQCSAPFMRKVNEASRLIVQHCADVCGCDPTPPVLKADGPAPTDPFAIQVEEEEVSLSELGGINGYNTHSGCCSPEPIYTGYN